MNLSPGEASTKINNSPSFAFAHILHHFHSNSRGEDFHSNSRGEDSVLPQGDGGIQPSPQRNGNARRSVSHPLRLSHRLGTELKPTVAPHTQE